MFLRPREQPWASLMRPQVLKKGESHCPGRYAIPEKAVAREFELSRDAVRKMLQYAVPPGYQRQQPIMVILMVGTCCSAAD